MLDGAAIRGMPPSLEELRAQLEHKPAICSFGFFGANPEKIMNRYNSSPNRACQH